MKKLVQLLACSIFLLGLISSSRAQGPCTASYTVSTSGTTVQFTNTSTGGVYYFWDFGDNTTSSAQSPTHTYNASGYYLVCLSIVDSMQNCSDYICDTIAVGNPSCYASFTWQGSTTNAPVYFYNASVGGTNYFWDFGDATTSTAANPNHTYSSPGTYNVCLTITNNSTSCIDTFCTTVTVSQQGPCNASFTTSFVPNTTTAQFTSTAGPGYYYYWSFGDNTFSSQQNPSHTYALPGTYMVCLTIYDSLQSCQDTYCDTITVGSTGCYAYFSYQANNVSNPVYFYNASSGGTNYFWDFGDATTSTQANPNHTYANPGTYNVCLTITNNSTNCIDTFCTNVTVMGQNNCIASFTYTSNGNVFQFSNTSTGGSNYMWDFGDNSTSSQVNPTHTYNSSGIYIVCLTVWDSVCQASYCDSVYVGPMGVGEAFQVTGINAYPNPFNDIVNISFELPQADDAEITVFDMLGSKVEVISTGKQAAGKNTIQWNASNISKGVYMLRITTPQGSAVKLLTRN